MSKHNLLMAVLLAAVLALAGCGGGGGGSPPPSQTPYQMALAKVNQADTAEKVDAAVDAEAGNLSGTELRQLETAATARKTALAKMGRTTAQKKALMDAAGMVDTSDLSDAAKLAKARTDIAKLQEAYDNAADVSETDKAPYKTKLDGANRDVRRQDQMNALSTASGGLRAALAAFSGTTPTQAQLDAANSALEDLKTALADAADLTDTEKREYQTQVANAPTSIRTAQGHFDAEEQRKDRERIDRIVKEITDEEIMAAMTAVGMVTDTSDDSTVTDAQTKIDEAKMAITEADIPEADREKLRIKLAVHEGAYARAIASREEAKRIEGIVKGIEAGEIMAVMEAIKKITSLSEESTVTDVETAIAAARKAIEGAKIPEANKAQLRTALAMQEKAFDDAKVARTDGAKMGKAMHAAMGPAKDAADPKNALSNLATVPYYIDRIIDSGNDTPTDADEKGERADFRIDPADGAGSIADGTMHTAVHFTHGEHDTDKGKVGRWQVTEYKRGADTVRVYNDREGGPDEFRGFVIPKDLEAYYEADSGGNKPTNAGTLTKEERKLSLGTAIDRFIASPTFTRRTGGAVGAVILVPADGVSDNPKVIKIRGTYHGAPGYYYCTPGTCTVGTGVGGGQFSGHFLSTDWHFVYDKGAKVMEKDFDYFYFGWWVRKDANGMPAAVSAFYQSVGGGNEITTDSGSLNGSATYEGPAIGQYAIHDPLNEKGDSGEFTATASLEAQFGTSDLNPDSGMTGTIDNFRLKGGSEDPGWSVTLNKSAWTTSTANTETASQGGHTTNTAKTVWTINGVKAAPAGSWVATMYDEKAGTVAEGGDGSNHPTSVLGKFYAEHGGTHRMVGAFGTKLQE